MFEPLVSYVAIEELSCRFFHTSVADSGDDGIEFNYSSPTSNQWVKVYNSTFWGSIYHDVDNNYPPTGLWFCNWATGKSGGGAGYGQGCMEFIPGWGDDLKFPSNFDGIDEASTSWINGLNNDFEGDDRLIDGNYPPDGRDDPDPGADEYDPNG